MSAEVGLMENSGDGLRILEIGDTQWVINL